MKEEINNYCVDCKGWTRHEFEDFDNVQQAYDYAIKLPSDWYIK